MESASQQFKQGLNKSYSTQIGKSASPVGMMTDMVNQDGEQTK